MFSVAVWVLCCSYCLWFDNFLPSCLLLITYTLIVLVRYVRFRISFELFGWVICLLYFDSELLLGFGCFLGCLVICLFV